MAIMPKRITAIELELLKIVLDKGEASAREVYDESLKERKRSYNTVKTLLDRMVERQFLNRRKDGIICIYKPKVTESQAVGRAIDDFVKNMLGGTFLPLFTYFVKKKKIKEKELNELKQLIEEAREK
jgi:predicted transcriptional regulator